MTHSDPQAMTPPAAPAGHEPPTPVPVVSARMRELVEDLIDAAMDAGSAPPGPHPVQAATADATDAAEAELLRAIAALEAKVLDLEADLDGFVHGSL